MCYCFHSFVGFARKQYCINFIYRNQTLSLKKSTSNTAAIYTASLSWKYKCNVLGMTASSKLCLVNIQTSNIEILPWQQVETHQTCSILNRFLLCIAPPQLPNLIHLLGLYYTYMCSSLYLTLHTLPGQNPELWRSNYFPAECNNRQALSLCTQQKFFSPE